MRMFGKGTRCRRLRKAQRPRICVPNQRVEAPYTEENRIPSHSGDASGSIRWNVKY